MAGRADVVVVGAGSAGAVLASRLSDDADRSVVLLEAGPDHTAADTPPGMAGPSFHRALAEPCRAWPGLVARRTADQAPRTYLRGRGVGGCSAVNAMIALPGVPGEWDGWDRSLGGAGWDWASMRRWLDLVPLPLHRAAGGERGPLSRALLASGLGAEAALLTRTAAGRRVSVNDAYLEPARGRPNLQVRGGALVDRVLLQGDRAAGVRLADGTEIEAATVVVAAGAIHSPAVLLRSGLALPGIGRGLQDHPSFPIAVRLHPEHVPALDSLALCALLRGRHAAADDLQVLVVDVADPAVPGVGAVMAALMQVHSRGAVTLASDDPHADPVIDFAMLTDERDVAGMHAAVALAERFLRSDALAAVGDVVPYDASEHGLRAGVGDYVHAASTCRAGLADDPLAVVDPWCRVHGHEGLLVCDASVFPAVPRANTHLPTVLLAERLAAFLRAS